MTTDQPTPTSSLEEARQLLRDSVCVPIVMNGEIEDCDDESRDAAIAEFEAACMEHAKADIARLEDIVRRLLVADWEFKGETLANARAAARAEVIREVEAVEGSLRESARRLSRFSNSYMDGESAGLIAAADALRALSQGGDG